MKSASVLRGRKNEGAVSLFAVIFAMLLMTVVTVSFLRIMISDQNQASGNDLAQSAYDSAQAGVEDAKRALLWYQGECASGGSGCTWDSSWETTCNAMVRDTNVVRAGDEAPTAGGSGTGEIKVQQSVSGNDTALDQAYTCVTISRDSPDYIGELASGASTMIPLTAAGTYNTLTVEWFNSEDTSSTVGAVNVGTTFASQPIQTQANWGADRPPILRTQYMQVGSNFNLSDFDYANTGSPGQSNANTLFLYPTSNGASTVDLLQRDSRPDSAGNSSAAPESYTPQPSLCTTTVASGSFSCKISITLPDPVGGGARVSPYLWLTAYNAATHYRLTLTNSAGTPVDFRGAQPIVDATGRANTVFRRVQSRINLQGEFPYPNGAVDVSGSFCKNFGVTNVNGDYVDNDTTCTP